MGTFVSWLVAFLKGLLTTAAANNGGPVTLPIAGTPAAPAPPGNTSAAVSGESGGPSGPSPSAAPAAAPVVAAPPPPIVSAAAARELDRILSATPASAGHGYAELTANLTGMEAEVGDRLTSNLSVGAYVGRTWSGDVDAGARMKLTW